MFRIRVVTLTATIAAIAVGAPAGALGGAVKGEPRFVGSLPAGSPAAATAHTLNAARLGLIRVAAHTNDPVLVARRHDQARSGAPVASHAASRWTRILAWAFAALAAFVFAGFALSRRARPLRARLGSTEATS
jgi:hypothetical protein